MPSMVMNRHIINIEGWYEDISCPASPVTKPRLKLDTKLDTKWVMGLKLDMKKGHMVEVLCPNIEIPAVSHFCVSFLCLIFVSREL